MAAAPDRSLSLSRLLDCVAISDALDGLLIYGASGATLEFLADQLAERLRAAGAPSVDRVWLGSADTEDALWGVPDLPFGWIRPGLLDPPDGTTRIVIVPDLSRLSLAAARAGVMVLGNRDVTLERRGSSRVLPIRHRWIAAVDDEHRDGVSRHLLDRFAIRVRFAAQAAGDRQRWLTKQFDAATLEGPTPEGPTPSHGRDTALARQRRSVVSAASATGDRQTWRTKQVEAAVPEQTTPSHGRGMTRARRSGVSAASDASATSATSAASATLAASVASAVSAASAPFVASATSATSATSAGAAVFAASAVSAALAAQRSVSVEDDAIDEVVALTGQAAAEGMRPAIALLHVARAIARLSGEARVDRAIVREAASMLGLRSGDDEVDGGEADEAQDARDARQPDADAPAAEPIAEPRVVTPVIDEEPQHIADARPSGPGDVVATPESELDGMPVPIAPEPSDRDTKPGPYGALRLPWQQTQAAASGRGTIIGTRRTDTLRDLAIVDTLLAAAPFQNTRRRALRASSGSRGVRGSRRWKTKTAPATSAPTSSKGLILRRADLRSYRRAPVAGDLLVLVLDYTSVAGREWLNTLVPFLADAYRLRAELCVVKVGAAGAANPLRADRMMARSVLVPSVAAALDEAAGRATPLADGLSLAFRTIRQTLGHGRATMRRATLVVVTDGRGNVSLEASRAGEWRTRIGRQGVDDAKKVARELRELPHVKRVLIDPGPEYLRDLPLGLAAALGAQVVAVERRDE